MKSILTSLLLCAVVLSLSISVTNCATMHGAGRDIESAGEAVQDAAR